MGGFRIWKKGSKLDSMQRVSQPSKRRSSETIGMEVFTSGAFIVHKDYSAHGHGGLVNGHHFEIFNTCAKSGSRQLILSTSQLFYFPDLSSKCRASRE
jgi:hypothetical protein